MSTSSVRLTPRVIGLALRDALIKLNPATRLRNPVLFIVGTCAFLVTAAALHDLWRKGSARGFDIAVAVWLWLIVIFANFAEALGEVREHVRADRLRRRRQDALANKVQGRRIQVIPASKLCAGDTIVVRTGELIPIDGEIVDGIATVDESVVTGESAFVIRESNSDRSSVTSGSRILSGELRIRVTAAPEASLEERMITALDNTTQEVTPDELRLHTLLSFIAIVCVVSAATLFMFTRYTARSGGVRAPATIAEAAAWLTALLPVAVTALLSTTGAAGMGRLVEINVLAVNRRVLEAMRQVTTVFLDKTGTVTRGDRGAVEFIPFDRPLEEVARVAALSSIGDETYEGRSILALAANFTPLPLGDGGTPVAFSSYTRMSGIDIGGIAIRKGAAEAIAAHARNCGAILPAEFSEKVEQLSRAGGTPLAVWDGTGIAGLIQLRDSISVPMKSSFDRLRNMGIRTVLITGDNPVTAQAIAEEIGADEVIAEATPADKLTYIKREQKRGEVVAMVGDEFNDAPALAQADIGIAMERGSTAAKDAASLLDLDNDPTKIVEIALIARDVYATRLSLLIFSIVVGVTQCGLVLPPVVDSLWPGISRLNILHLHSGHTAILSSTIVKALAVLCLLPVAWRGVMTSAVPLRRLLWRNLLTFAVIGALLPLPGLWLLDRLLFVMHLR